MDSVTPPTSTLARRVARMGVRPDAVARLMRLYWRLATYFQTICEDLDGVQGRAPYLANLKLRLVETAYDLDELIDGSRAVTKVHQLALSFEHGSPLLGLDGAGVAHLVLSSTEGAETEARRLKGLAEDVLAATPGALVSPLTRGGQRFVLRMLRRWSEISAATGEDLSFLRTALRNL
jgi:hypothetical protein